MKKIIYTLLATLSAVVLLFGYRTSHEAVVATAAPDVGATSGAAAAPVSSGTGSSAASSSGSASSGASSTTTDAAAPPASSGLTDGTYLGSAANTRYGPVQVQVAISGGVITDVQVPEYPDSNGKDRQINERALPTLVSATTRAQSADVDMVSGATYTSDGYIRSLQSALDQAAS